ncbi:MULTISPECIES: glycosyltransferase [unclassified Microbacterium]|uniref:glycosyltransferase n=1 Tax=unclassified Microbacterium TaxID=2609290 RepID=UPI00214CF1D3|nr:MULTISPECIES: glycosyltransferase [unclassified Microbacterium]MCR2784790.1 glycosyltransferase [Microbacterium sp. zg.B96]WIM16329.1 glycosyltransferase [Microbacterium sp. zg-B96]
MRVVIDAMGSPDRSGGMNLYARELVASWAAGNPDDAITVIAGPWAADAFVGHPNIAVRVVRSGSSAARAWTQLVSSGVVFHRSRADALVSLSPLASPLVPARHRAVVVHDWRHESRPGEFGVAQRWYRRLWRWSARTAGTTIAISDRTAAESRRHARPRRLVVVENGADHPRRWRAVVRRPGDEVTLVTYGHLPNKRPEAVIRALALVPDGTLWVLGAQGRYRQSLEQLAASCGIAHRVRLPGFVPDQEYHRLLATASAVVLNSSDEGFGFPVVEAGYFGIPVIAAADSGLHTIHGRAVRVSAPDPRSIAEAILAAVRDAPGHATAARSWARCAEETRAAVAGGSRP